MDSQLDRDPVCREFRALCRKLGWRVTASRLAVYRFVRENKSHPVIDSVWEAVKRELPNISRESVYRILTDFADKGVIYQLERPDVVARYDSNPRRHDHFYCERCGRVFDFSADEVDAIARAAANKLGAITRVEARVTGICEECLRKEQTRARRP